MESSKTYNESMNMDFQEWLQKDDYSTPIIHVTDKRCKIVIKIQRSNNFDYLFVQDNFTSNGIERDNSFEYTGIYFKKNGLIYDERGNLDTLLYTNTGKGKIALSEQLQQSVREKVEYIINNNKNNLDIEVLQNTERINKYIEMYTSNAKEAARNLFLDDTFEYDSLVFECEYTPDKWTEESLLDYIETPEEYVEQETKKYITNHQEDILDVFTYNELIGNEYNQLAADKDNPIHIIKKIMQSTKKTDAQNVTVTIKKNGIPFEFKTTSAVLRSDPGQLNYSTWYMESSKRKEFREIFGVGDGYKPEEIVSITYRNKTLYQKEESK